MIQKLIEVEEDRIIEEVQVQRRRLSQMQQEERKAKASILATISQQLRRALEIEEVDERNCNDQPVFYFLDFFQRRRKEKEELCIELACEEKEDAEARKMQQLEYQEQAQKLERKQNMEHQLELNQQKKKILEKEAQFERLWVNESFEYSFQWKRLHYYHQLFEIH